MRLPIYLSKRHLKNCRKYIITVITTACYVYSGCWLSIEILSHFRPTFEQWSRGNHQMFVIIVLIGLVIGVFHFLQKCVKTLAVSHKLEGQDISIEIRVGSIFNVDGSFVISTNTTFDTDMSEGPITPRSLQGQFTNKYYSNSAHLEQDLTNALNNEENVVYNNEQTEKTQYEVGTVVKISVEEQIAYFVAIDEVKELSGIESSLDNVRKGLGSLWYYVGKQGVLDALVIPVLGTGHSGIPVSREQMILEIITSFIAGCTEKKFCEELTIVISEDDYRKHDIALEDLGSYLKLYCREVHLKTYDIVSPVDNPIY